MRLSFLVLTGALISSSIALAKEKQAQIEFRKPASSGEFFCNVRGFKWSEVTYNQLQEQIATSVKGACNTSLPFSVSIENSSVLMCCTSN